LAGKTNIWHTQKIEDIFKALKTSERGLTAAEAERRLDEYGPNELEKEKGMTKLSLLGNQFKNPLVAVLFAAALI
jgi:Ca2+-transporting ATPase